MLVTPNTQAGTTGSRLFEIMLLGRVSCLLLLLLLLLLHILCC